MTSDDQDTSDFVRTCRRAGLRATFQRTEILSVLSTTNAHPDAETIYEKVRARIPTISLDTVYRTLRVLEEKGVISRVGSVRDRTRFEANTEKHHHFVCTGCGRVEDFRSEALDALELPAEVSSDVDVESIYIEARGLCRTCRDKSDREEN